jgi:hypothetical protein
VFIPGEGFRAAPLPPWVPPAPAQPLAPPVPAGSPEAAGEPQAAEKGLTDASNPSPPERPHVESMEGCCGTDLGRCRIISPIAAAIAAAMSPCGSILPSTLQFVDVTGQYLTVILSIVTLLRWPTGAPAIPGG